MLTSKDVILLDKKFISFTLEYYMHKHSIKLVSAIINWASSCTVISFLIFSLFIQNSWYYFLCTHQAELSVDLIKC